MAETTEVKLITSEPIETPEGTVTIDTASDFSAYVTRNGITGPDDPSLLMQPTTNGGYLFSKKINNVPTPLFRLSSQAQIEFFWNYFLDMKNLKNTTSVSLTTLGTLIITKNTKEETQKIMQEASDNYKQATDKKHITGSINKLLGDIDQQIIIADKNENNKLFTNNFTKEQRTLWTFNKEQLQERRRNIVNIQNGVTTTNENDVANLSRYSDDLINYYKQLSVYKNEAAALTTGKETFPTEYHLRFKDKAQIDSAQSLLQSIRKNLEKENKTLKEAGLESVTIQELEHMQKYLEDAIVTPPTEAYKPINKQAFAFLVTTNPKLYDVFENINKKNNLTKQGDKTGITPPDAQGNTIVNGTNGTQQETGKSTTGTNTGVKPEVSRTNAEYSDADNALRKGGLFGSLDHATKDWQDQSERGQNFYTAFGNIALLAGGIFLGVKAIKSTWRLLTGKSEKDKTVGKDLGRLGGAAGLLFLTAGRPQDLFKGGYASEKVADFMNWIGIGGTNAAEKGPVSPESATAIMALFNGKTYGDIKNSIDIQDGVMKFKPSVYDALVAKNTTTINDPKASDSDKFTARTQNEFLKSIGKDDTKGILNMALTSMNITPDTLATTKPDTPFNETATEFITRSLVLAKYMKDNSLATTSKEGDALVQNYLKTGEPSLEDLQARGVFEKEITLSQKDKDDIENQVKKLEITDDATRNQLIHSLQLLKQLHPNTIFALSKENGTYFLESHGQKTAFDANFMKTKNLPGLGIDFSTTLEMLKATNLTNRIKDITKNQTSSDQNPFYLEKVLNRLTFDNTKMYEVWKQDTTLVSNEGIANASPNIANNKQKYVDYLNNLWQGGAFGSKPEYVPAAVVTTGVTTAAGASSLESEEAKKKRQEEEEAKKKKDKIKEENSDLPADVEIPEDQTNNLIAINALQLPKAEITKIKENWLDAYKQNPHWKDLGANLVAHGEKLALTTYGKETSIDFGERAKQQGDQIKNLNVKFDDYAELFRVANLTNFIRDTFEKNNPDPSDMATPFYLMAGLFDIKFNDRNSFWNTDVVSATVPYWGTLAKVSPTLGNKLGNKELFVDYINKAWLGDRVHGLHNLYTSGLSTEGIRASFEDFQKFYKDFSDPQKDVSFVNYKELIKGKRNPAPFLFMQTRGEKTPIDLKQKKIIGLDITFSTTEDLFHTADLINQIFFICKDKTANSESPFNISRPGGDLEFNDTADTFFDKEYATSNYLEKKSSQFSKRDNKALLADYLNGTRQSRIHRVD